MDEIKAKLGVDKTEKRGESRLGFYLLVICKNLCS